MSIQYHQNHSGQSSLEVFSWNSILTEDLALSWSCAASFKVDAKHCLKHELKCNDYSIIDNISDENAYVKWISKIVRVRSFKFKAAIFEVDYRSNRFSKKNPDQDKMNTAVKK